MSNCATQAQDQVPNHHDSRYSPSTSHSHVLVVSGSVAGHRVENVNTVAIRLWQLVSAVTLQEFPIRLLHVAWALPNHDVDRGTVGMS